MLGSRMLESTNFGARCSSFIAMDLDWAIEIVEIFLPCFSVASGVVGLQHGKQSEDIPTDLE